MEKVLKVIVFLFAFYLLIITLKNYQNKKEIDECKQWREVLKVKNVNLENWQYEQCEFLKLKLK